MTTRNPFLPIRPEDLQVIAREASSEHLSNGLNLTDCVVKAASLFGQPLTSEHVRRVCEMTYHDVFERKFREKTGSMDRLISFDPPDAVEAADRLRAKKIASSRPKGVSPTMGTQILDKVASVSTTKRLTKVNAFDEMVKQASGNVAQVIWHNPLRELCDVREQVKASISELKTRLGSVEENEKFASSALAAQAYQAYKNGASTVGVIHACVAAVDMDKYASGLILQLIEDLTYKLASNGCALSAEKVASHGDPNPNHPLPQRFKKVADLREERLHLEYALVELQADWREVNEGINALHT